MNTRIRGNPLFKSAPTAEQVLFKSTYFFDELDEKSVGVAGGKGMNLAIMIKNGIPVPPGFVVSAPAFDVFMNGVKVGDRTLGEIIREKVESINPEDTTQLSELSKEIKDMIMDAEMPEKVRKAIVDSYRKLVEESGSDYVAVRSSATCEDSSEASFAGQQETFLNVKGEDSVVEMVKRCWASLYGERSIYYRKSKGFSEAEVSIAVVVQEMVQSKASGILFTTNPTDPSDNSIVINAVLGLGEYAVGGKVSPDEYKVDPDSMKILEKDISKQQVMLMKKEKNGRVVNEEVKVPEDKQEEQKIPDEKILELAEIGKNILALYGGVHQDVEWAMDHDGRLYIVQSRPVTTLITSQELIPFDKREVLCKGTTGSPGVAVGKVHMIDLRKAGGDPEKERELLMKGIDEMEDGAVLVTTMTTPDFVPAMKKASAIVTAEGGKLCHAAIVSRELGKPCIVGTAAKGKSIMEVVKEGEWITVDATRGQIYKGRVDMAELREDSSPKEMFMKMAAPAIITRTKILVNLAQPSQAKEVAAKDVDGVGLARFEFIYLNVLNEKFGGKHPSLIVEEGKAEELAEALAEGIADLARPFGDRPVVLRLSDFKTNEYAKLKGGERMEPKEENPMFGWRGVCRYTDPKFKDVFLVELEAVRRVREDHGLNNVWVMVPFIRTPEELAEVVRMINDYGLKQGPDFKIWMMAEVPANAIRIKEFIATGIDGISIGSNDLTQGTLMADRDSGILTDKYTERDESVKEMIRLIARGAREYEREVGKHITLSICGQAPSFFPDYQEFLVELGFDSISVNPDAIETARKNVARFERMQEERQRRDMLYLLTHPGEVGKVVEEIKKKYFG